jgi:hypothetical protein
MSKQHHISSIKTVLLMLPRKREVWHVVKREEARFELKCRRTPFEYTEYICVVEIQARIGVIRITVACVKKLGDKHVSTPGYFIYKTV